MPKSLKQKWKVSNTQFFLILCTFAVTGTLTAFISRSITQWLGMDESVFWLWRFLPRLAVLVFGYQLVILLVSVVFGQFRFFWNYEKKILNWIGIPVDRLQMTVDSGEMAAGHLAMAEGVDGSQMTVERRKSSDSERIFHLAIFASGTGSNAQKLIERFRSHPKIRVSLIVCNKSGAGVLNIAENEKIPTLLIEKERFFQGDAYLGELKKAEIDAIVLAGFLWKIPSLLIKTYSGRIINIHPALLPKYGGKGMYGHFVHEAVIGANEKESGITIHYVDDVYDHGDIIFQTTCPVSQGETPESLAKKIQFLEHLHFPRVVEEWVQLQNQR